jgi:hypothetical protein
MATAAFNEKKLQGIVKSALADAFKENRELMQDIVQEALEDIAMGRAIEQGLETKPVTRKKVFSILEGGCRRAVRRIRQAENEWSRAVLCWPGLRY